MFTISKKLIDEFNQKESILVVTSYKDRKEGIKNLNAVAWYARKTVAEMAKLGKCKFIVLAEVVYRQEVFKDGNVLVVRCWKRGTPLLYLSLLRWFLIFNKANTSLISFEFNIFGGLASTGSLPIFLLALKLLGKRIIVEVHQVLLNLDQLSGHLNIARRSVKFLFFNLTLRLFYQMLHIFANKIVVLEEELKERYEKLCGKGKIALISHFVFPKNESLKNAHAKRLLNLKSDDFVLLQFGFVAWYKGVDWLINVVNKLPERVAGRPVRLIVAGGESATLKDREHYQKYWARVNKLVKKSSKITLTGFVEDKDIPLYFSASDLVVFPYRAFMSSSGPLSWAFSFKKPFILSSKLLPYFESQDFQKGLVLSDLKEDRLTFNLSFSSFKNLLVCAISDKMLYSRLTNLSSNIARMRNASSSAKIYLKLLQDVHYSSYSFGVSFNKLFPKRLAFRLGQPAS